MRKNELDLGPHGRELAEIDKEIGETFGELCRLEGQLKAYADKHKDGIKACKERLEVLNTQREGALHDAPDAPGRDGGEE